MVVDDDAELGSQHFTFKNMVAFFTLFGWVGVAGTQAGWNKMVVVFTALLAGIAMVALMLFMLSRILRLQQSGTMQIKNAIIGRRAPRKGSRSTAPCGSIGKSTTS